VDSRGNLSPGTVIEVRPHADGTWPERPTARGDIVVHWSSGPVASDPPIVNSGTGGMLNNVDVRLIHGDDPQAPKLEDEHPMVAFFEGVIRKYKQGRGYS